MDHIAWILWLVLAVGLIVTEIFTLGFVLFWFGIGALTAAIAAFLGLGFGWQFAVFAVTSTALTAMSRTIFSTYFPQSSGNEIRSGVDAMPGKIGTVTSASNGALKEAAVKAFGSTWTAYPIDGESVLMEGEKVEIVEVRGSSVYVRHLREGLPEWREH